MSCLNFDDRFLLITLVLAPESINIATTTPPTVKSIFSGDVIEFTVNVYSSL